MWDATTCWAPTVRQKTYKGVATLAPTYTQRHNLHFQRAPTNFPDSSMELLSFTFFTSTRTGVESRAAFRLGRRCAHIKANAKCPTNATSSSEMGAGPVFLSTLAHLYTHCQHSWHDFNGMGKQLPLLCLQSVDKKATD